MTTVIPTPEPEMWPIAIDWALAFSRPPVRSACAYWQSLCQGRRMPTRRELDPSAMKEFIRYVNLVSVAQRGANAFDYVVTLQSNHARDILGNVENRGLSEFLSSTLEQRWHSSFDLPSLNRAPVRITTRTSSFAKRWLECEVLLAPLGQENEVEAIFWVFMAWPAEPKRDR